MYPLIILIITSLSHKERITISSLACGTPCAVLLPGG